MIVKVRNFSAPLQDRFRELQRASFRVLEDTAAELRGGETEKDVGRSLVQRYRKIGANAFFHLPVVLFGERTALPGAWPIGKFFPRDRALAANDSVILDAAPLIDGFLVDTSYSFCFGSNADHKVMMEHLSQYRRSVPEAVNAGATFEEIALSVQSSMAESGYEAVHNKHPGSVLGHRAIKTPNLPFRPRLKGFDALSLTWFRIKDAMATSGVGRRSPLWNAQKTSRHAPHDGLWLVEPHAGKGPTGAKWEEILVIEKGKARWLDDDPPHVRQWEMIAANQDYGPST